MDKKRLFCIKSLVSKICITQLNICIFILHSCITKDKIMLFYAFFFHFIWLFAKYIVILQPLNE